MKKKIRLAKRIGVLFLLLVTMMGTLVVPAQAASIQDILFDSTYYAQNNRDVVNALGSSEAAVKGHYNQYGRREGRSPSDLFDPVWYLSAYSDLKAAFGNDYEAAYWHFINHGIAEGRQGSPNFNLAVYKANYEDLRRAFGTASSDNWEYLQHWVQYGRREGRNAVTPLGAGTSAKPASESGTTAYVKTSRTTTALNMRSGPGTSYGITAKLSYGTEVTLLSTSGSWAKIRVNGKTGYVSAQYLSASKPAAASTALHTPVAAGAKFSKKTNDNGWYGYHDINRNVSSKTPVYAITGGTAYFYQYNTDGRLRSYGNYVKFVSADGQYEVRYAHLSRFEGMNTPITADTAYPCSGAADKGYVGSRTISAGEVLGYVGTTGNSSGTHLHIEVYRNGSRVDPTSLFSGLV